MSDGYIVLTIFGVTIILSIIGRFFVIKRKKSKLSNYNIIEEIDMSKYLVGFEDYNYEANNMLCQITDDEFLFTTQNGNIIGIINKDSLTNIFLEDKSTVGQRLTATRILTLGIFSLAAPKKKKNKEYCIVFEWEDINGEKNNVVFEFSGMACEVLSTESFNKLKKYKPITTKKCPFCDETQQSVNIVIRN